MSIFNSEMVRFSVLRCNLNSTRCTALIALVFLQYGEDEPLLELADRLRIQNVAVVHLQNKRFELILHGLSLSLEKLLQKPLRFFCLPDSVSTPQPRVYLCCSSRRSKSSP